MPRNGELQLQNNEVNDGEFPCFGEENEGKSILEMWMSRKHSKSENKGGNRESQKG